MSSKVEWLPMYTAPKDGQVDILCYAPGNPRADAHQDQEPLMKVDYYSKGDGGWRRMRPRNPYTHWMPLPAPPVEKTNSEAQREQDS